MLGSQKPKTNRNQFNNVQNGIGIDIYFKLFYHLAYGVTIFLELGRVKIKYN